MRESSPDRPARIALGIRPHSGWAILVAVSAGDAGDAPAVLHRVRVDLCPARLPRQVYHDVGERGLSPTKAAARIAQVEAAVAAEALKAVRATVDATGARAVALVAEPRSLPELSAILASHPMWHSAEGELYRDALAEAGRSLGLPVLYVPPKRVRAEAARALSSSDALIDGLLVGIGKSVGAPWQRDHKDATLAGLIAMASA